MGSEPVGLDIGESSALITKIIVEMKQTFNSDKKETTPGEEDNDSNSANPDDSEVVKNDIEGLNDTRIDVISPSIIPENTAVEEEILQENNIAEEANQPEEIKETVLSPEESRESNESEDKPRIVMHFRKPKNDANMTKKRSFRNKVQETQLKRSARRTKSKDGESVLQSAIARKEKSYNEGIKPQRLTRQLKLTPKILENLNQNQLKETIKNKSTRMAEKQSDNNDRCVNMSEGVAAQTAGENCRKHKLKCTGGEKQSKRTNKRLKSSQSDSDIDQCEKIVKENSNSSGDQGKSDIKLGIEERRRSQRRSTSKYKEEETLEISNVADVKVQEASLAEEESMFPAHPECSSVGAELIASKLCLCTKQSNIYSSENEKETFCTAVDSVGEKLVGCNNLVDSNEKPMFRMSTRVPFGVFCEVHRNRMLRHNCCPTCGVFCTQGRFVECERKHHYHRNCQIVVGDAQCCPHCGQNTPEHDVIITMYSTNRPVFLTKQRIFHSPAKMTFPSHNDYNTIPRSVSPLMPAGAFEIPAESNSLYDNCDIDTIFDVIKREDYKTLASILGSKAISMISTLIDDQNTNIIHYCAKNGYLPAVHMLLAVGTDLDLLDKDQNTPLMAAVVAFKNDVVRYLIKAGVNISIKGTDGMTALHLAAEYGNLEACELLVSSAINKLEYVNSADDGGWTALVWACENNHVNVAKYLLRKGADPSLRDLKQNVALHWAAFSGCQENVELLLNYGTDVNVVNAQGDTPLHIAARQGKYNTVIILLVRGANANILNKLQESALDCSQQYEDCYKLILLNVTIQAIQSQYNRKIVLSNDITNGKELNPIQCVNVLDSEPFPTNYIYVTDYCITSDINIDYKITSLHSCTCNDNCTVTDCSCVRNSLTNWYDEDGRLLPHLDFADAPLVFECNQVCSCNALTCNNRVVQRGLSQRFQLFRTEKKGWGMRTLNAVVRGSFVCEYIGEVVSDVEADQREDDSYFFGLDNHDECYSIDSRKYGNFGRFINHSCSPNLTPIKVFTNHQDLRFPRIAFFANRDILAEEELCFDYGDKFWSVKCKFFPCECRSLQCRYSKDVLQMAAGDYELSSKD